VGVPATADYEHFDSSPRESSDKYMLTVTYVSVHRWEDRRTPLVLITPGTQAYKKFTLSVEDHCCFLGLVKLRTDRPWKEQNTFEGLRQALWDWTS